MADFHPDSIRNDTDSKTLGRQVMAHTRDPDLVIFFHALEVSHKTQIVAKSESICLLIAQLYLYLAPRVIARRPPAS
jgi:hypothetical protein